MENPGFVYILVMEQPDSGEAHHDAVFIAGLDDIVVTDGSARLCDVADAAAVSTLYIVTKGEECI